MADRILLRRGNLADLPTLTTGEPGFATDSKTLYIGTASGNQKIVSASATVQTWIAPTLLNSWVNLDGTRTAGYYKDDLGIVRLKGVIKSGTTTDATNIFVLPAGYRPIINISLATQSSDGTTRRATAIDILTNGSAQIYSAASTFLLLDGISFRAEQ